jgi:hypothetical protein
MLAAAVFSAGCATHAPTRRLDAGFLLSRDSTLDGAERLRLAGPLVETQSSTGRLFKAFRPFYSEREEPVGERTARYFLWPVASQREFGKESSWRFLLLFGHDFDREEPGSRYRLFLFPLFFAGRDAQRDPYMALFPVGGSVHEFLGQDRIAFFLFPLYCHATVNKTELWNFFWPIFARTEGPGVHRWRVFPLYGESEQEGKWSKRFVLWPFWTQSEYYFTNSSGHAWMLWPLVGRVALTNQSSWMVLPPFFRWTETDHRRAFYGPWPFFQYGAGDEERLHIWPLWGRSRGTNDYRGFALWPIVRWGGVRRGGEQARWVDVAPIWHHDIHRAVATNAVGSVVAGETSATHTRLWPLFSYRRDGDGSRLRVPELWPLPATEGVEQNWAPLWSLYLRSRWAGAGEDELLWGLYRRRSDRDGWSLSLFPLFAASAGDGGRKREWSVLHGLVGYRRNDSGRMVRLLYLIRFRSQTAKESENKTP